jgi:hypothetical protein
MSDYAFQHPPDVAPGRVVFRISNAGSRTHSMVLVELPEDLPPIREQLRSDVRQPVDNLARLPDRPAGSRDTFAVDLVPGRYGMVCFVADPDGVSHALKGMSSEFRVR